MMKKSVLSFIFSAMLLLSSCDKILDIHSTRLVNEANFWNTIEDSRAALLGVYGLSRAAMVDNYGHWIYGDLRRGDFESLVREDLRYIIDNKLNAGYQIIDELSDWRKFYAVIHAANTFLERISEVKAKDQRYTENTMKVDIAQVRYLRAFAYFYMVRIWGDVPFILSSRDGEFENKPRSDQRAILEFVQSEMLEAIEDLPNKYSANDEIQAGLYYNSAESRWSGALIRKIGVYATLAHVAAWQGKYADVTVYSKYVMDNYSSAGTNYVSTTGLTNANGLFYDKNYNQLVGFPFTYNYQESSFTGTLESLTLAQPIVNRSLPDIYVSKDSILSIFSENFDGRFNIDSTGVVHSQAYFSNFIGRVPVFSKIKVIQSGVNDPSFRLYSSAVVFSRLEDITLLRAEALTVLGQKSEAITLLNRARQLRYNVDYVGLTTTGYVPYNEATHGPLLQEIFKERRKELMGEGHAWYDLIRYHKIIKQDSKFLKLIDEGGIYWPVAKKNIDQNQLLTQTPYWK